MKNKLFCLLAAAAMAMAALPACADSTMELCYNGAPGHTEISTTEDGMTLLTDSLTINGEDYVFAETFLDENGNPGMCAEGYHRYEAKLDDEGNITSVNYLDTEYQLVMTQFGFAGYNVSWSGDIEYIRFFDDRMKPVECVDGYASISTNYAPDHTQAIRSYSRLDGTPFIWEDGTAGEHLYFDSNGNVTRYELLDKDLNPLPAN